jgi:hypothetical protein
MQKVDGGGWQCFGSGVAIGFGAFTANPMLVVFGVGAALIYC